MGVAEPILKSCSAGQAGSVKAFMAGYDKQRPGPAFDPSTLEIFFSFMDFGSDIEQTMLDHMVAPVFGRMAAIRYNKGDFPTELHVIQAAEAILDVAVKKHPDPEEYYLWSEVFEFVGNKVNFVTSTSKLYTYLKNNHPFSDIGNLAQESLPNKAHESK